MELTLLAVPDCPHAAVDPFAAPGQSPGLSCRLYLDATGRTSGVPSTEALRQALAAAGHD